jgi:hypothetical protein
MGLPKVDKFLFCLELETGGVIIGVLNAIISALLFLFFAFTMALLLFAVASHEGHQKETTFVAIGDEVNVI